jgi:hypothetical protein
MKELKKEWEVRGTIITNQGLAGLSACVSVV